MFERFTPRARHAVVLAQDEARRLDQPAIGPEHLLLGLLGEPDAVAGRALQQIGISLAATRREVENLSGRGTGAGNGHVPFTAPAKKVLELSLREALNHSHNYIGTEHILLGLLRLGESPATKVLEGQGASLDAVRRNILEELRKIGGAASAEPGERTSRTPAAEAVIATAQALAGGAPMGSHHLLEAMLLLEGSLAANTLAALGVDPNSAAAKMDELGIAGTTDVTPEDAAARLMDIHVDKSEVRITMRDEVSRDIVQSLVVSMGNPIRGDDLSDSALLGVWRALVGALQQLQIRTDEDATPDALKDTTSSMVRDAIRNRLRRRRNPES